MMEDEEPEQAVAHEAEAESDDLDEQLEEALARWEPRLESKDRSPAATEPEELVLSDDDVINGSSTPEPATPDDDELDDIMDFLDLADEPVESAAPSANGQGHDSNGLSDRKSSGVTTSVGGPADDDDYVELSAMLAEDLEEDEPEPPEATDETGMTAGPQEQTDQRSHEPSFAEAESEFPDDSEFFGVGRDAGKAEARGEFADPFSSEGGEGNDDLIDLDSMGPITRYEPASGGVSDTSTLTLHPMFFDQDAPDLPGGSEAGGMDKDHDGWITR